MAKLKGGDKAPNFQLLDQEGGKVRLADFKGRKLLVYFYPRASMPGCTTQSCEVSKARAAFQARGVDVVGISPDTPDRQKKFDEKFKLGFPLLSDPDNAAATAFGVWGEKSMRGKKYMGVIRSSFLIDEKGRILEAWYKISPKDTVPEARSALE